MRAAYDVDGLPSFLAVYYEGTSVLLGERDFYDLAMAYFRKARSQNVVYLRDLSAESAMQTLEESLPYDDWIVGVGLASDEKGNRP